MFTGFTEDTFAFFMAIRFNNNRDFFHANHDWYMRSVREPFLALAEDVGDTIADIDPFVETRPNRVVSRINRDIRFSHDKSPYRDCMFLAFRRPGEQRKSTMGLFFDMSDSGASYGAGFYADNMPLMNALRTQIRLDPENTAEQLDIADFTLVPNTIKRMQVPDDVPDGLKMWYPLRGFYVEKEIRDMELLKSPSLADELKAGYRRLEKMYGFIQGLIPEEDE